VNRGGYFRAFTAAAAIAGLSYGAAFGNALGAPSFGPIVIETGPRVHVQGPGGKREPMRTVRDRARGKDKDPFFGIASKGRRGARERMLKMEAALATTPRGTLAKRTHGGKVKSKPFLDRTPLARARNAAFVAALNDGKGHNEALKLARRVSA
jgi:hypothetical protein